MKTKTAITIALIATGKYDVPGKSAILNGYDMYGEKMTETIPDIDHGRLDLDIDAILAGKMPSPLKQIDKITVKSLTAE